jgi:hypothetical protein
LNQRRVGRKGREINTDGINLIKVLYSCVKYHSNPVVFEYHSNPVVFEYHNKNEGQECETDPTWGWVLVKGEG